MGDDMDIYDGDEHEIHGEDKEKVKSFPWYIRLFHCFFHVWDITYTGKFLDVEIDFGGVMQIGENKIRIIKKCRVCGKEKIKILNCD